MSPYDEFNATHLYRFKRVSKNTQSKVKLTKQPTKARAQQKAPTRRLQSTTKAVGKKYTPIYPLPPRDKTVRHSLNNDRRLHAGGQVTYIDTAAMLADPCGPTLVAGQYGTVEGSLVRTRRSIANNGANVSTCGYVVWCPDYTPGIEVSPDGFTEGNLFVWTAVSSSTTPLNESAAPFGLNLNGDGGGGQFPVNGVMNTAGHVHDPATVLADSGIMQDARCLSACVQINMTGQSLTTSGEYCQLDSITIQALMGEGIGISSPASSVDDLFDYCSAAHPFTKNSVEVNWRPSLTSAIFRGGSDSVVHMKSNFPTTLSESAEGQTPRFFGIAWRGLSLAAPNPFSVTFVKNLEFRLPPIAHMAHKPPEQVPATIIKALTYLDTKLPSWQDVSDDAKTLDFSKLFKGAQTVYAVGSAVAGMAGLFAAAPVTPGSLSDAAPTFQAPTRKRSYAVRRRSQAVTPPNTQGPGAAYVLL